MGWLLNYHIPDCLCCNYRRLSQSNQIIDKVMFSRRLTFAFSPLSAETAKIGVRHSAYSKKNRIQVQLLQNVPGYGIAGEVIKVKPTVAINRLQPYNRAYILLKGAEPRIPVVTVSKAERLQILNNSVVRAATDLSEGTTEIYTEIPNSNSADAKAVNNTRETKEARQPAKRFVNELTLEAILDSVQKNPAAAKSQSATTSTEADSLFSMDDLLGVSMESARSEKKEEDKKALLDAMPELFTIHLKRQKGGESASESDYREVFVDSAVRDLSNSLRAKVPLSVSPAQYFRTVTPVLLDSESNPVESIDAPGNYIINLLNAEQEIEFSVNVEAKPAQQMRSNRRSKQDRK